MISAIHLPDELADETKQLVTTFATALAEKLMRSQTKYNRGTSWLNTDWMDECRAELRRHTDKGDPLDVAAYSAFLWYHKQSSNV